MDSSPYWENRFPGSEDGTAKTAKQKKKDWTRLRSHEDGYPPDKQEKATHTVLEQAEVLSRAWALA